MSYTVDWIKPIYDRTYGDVIAAETDRYLVEPKGCYNPVDLNRIENNTKYVMEDMTERGIIRVPPSLAIKLNWNENDIATRDDVVRIVQNVQLLMSLSNPEVFDDFDIIYESTQFTYALANAIERNLKIMKNQPLPPPKTWLLKVINGIILENNSSQMFVAENQIVNIQFVPFGEDAEFMGFTHWSGNTDDLQYVGNVNSPVTTYQMQYHDYDEYIVELTGNYATMIPRKLTLHGATIYDEIGGSTRTLFAGNEVLLLANVAPIGKRFLEWRGTQEGLDNIHGGVEPSTAWFVMPDCDVDLTSFYINAGQHAVYVDGYLLDWYDYGETVTISPQVDKGPKYTFSHWSGDTQYLEDVTNSTFKMPDVNVSFTSNWDYIREQYQLVVNNGYGSGIYYEDEQVTITAYDSSDNMKFIRWTLDDGAGHITSSSSKTTTFHMTDSNAVVTANFAPTHAVIINNYNNSGTSHVFYAVEGYAFTVSSPEIVGDKIIDYWRLDTGEKTSLPYFTETMGTEDRVFTVYYRNRRTYHLTVNNGSGDGDYLERSSVVIIADPPPVGQHFDYWSRSSDIWNIGYPYASTTTVVIGHDDCYVTANYATNSGTGGGGSVDPGGGGDTPGGGGTTPEPQPTYRLVVNNGSGDGRYHSGTRVTCKGDEAPDGYEFSHWTENGASISYQNPYYFYMPDKDREITAEYKPIPYFTVTVINGKLPNGQSTGTFVRNSNPIIYMDPAPEGMKFFQWEVIEGTEDDVQHILAETTRIRNLTHDITVRATYYIPNPEILYTLSIVDKLGNTTTENYPMGEQIPIMADEPDEGYRFYKWIGDTQYVVDKYSPNTIFNMPGKNATLKMEYRREDFITLYHVMLFGGELFIETDPETGDGYWDIEGEFEERSVIPIRAIDIPHGWKFNGWKNDDDEGKSLSTVHDLMAEETFITVEDFDIALTRDVIEKDKYSIGIINGEISGTYYEDDPVPVYFNLQDTELAHYTFVRWSGDDTSGLRLFDTGALFDITVPGTPDYPQTIKMPSKNIIISAVYTTAHRLSVNNITNGYYEEGTTVKLSAENVEGKRFTYWTGDTSYVDNPYNPNITVKMPDGSINLVPNYHNGNDNNSVGYSLTSLSGNDTINIEDIVIISGEVNVGFLITDNAGHMYIVTDITENIATIMKLTTTQGGDQDGQ